MKIEKFWNQAFLAALARLPAGEAKKEADTATELCIAFWRENRMNWAPLSIKRWQEQDVTDVPKRYETMGTSRDGTAG